MDSEKRKLIFMAVLAVVLLVSILALLYLLFFNSKDEVTDATTTSFPESEERTDLEPISEVDSLGVVPTSSEPTLSETDADTAVTIPPELQGGESGEWRNEVIAYSEQGRTDSVANTSSGTPEPLVDEVGDGLDGTTGGDYPISYDYSDYYPAIIELPNGKIMSLEDSLDFDKFNEATNPIPSLVDEFDSVESCGTLQIPTSDSALKAFMTKLDKTEEAICLGEAVLHDCEPAWALVNLPEDMQMWVYVATRSDGMCGFGTTMIREYVNLCNMADTLRAVTARDMLFEDILKTYADEPGMLFKDIYSADQEFIGDSDFDCQLHEV
jgi:hypothetical protein